MPQPVWTSRGRILSWLSYWASSFFNLYKSSPDYNLNLYLLQKILNSLKLKIKVTTNVTRDVSNFVKCLPVCTKERCFDAHITTLFSLLHLRERKQMLSFCQGDVSKSDVSFVGQGSWQTVSCPCCFSSHLLAGWPQQSCHMLSLSESQRNSQPRPLRWTTSKRKYMLV